MSFLSGLTGGNLFSSIVNTAAQAALAAATGGTSLALSSALQTVMSSIGSQILQQVGQQLGLPQPAIDLAQSAFAGASGNAAAFTPSPGQAAVDLAAAVGGGTFEAGQIERQMNDIVKDMVDKTLEKMRNDGRDEDGNSTGGVNGSGGKQSFMMRLALALGKVLDAKMERMAEIGESMDKESQKDKPKLGSLSAEMTAVGKELDYVSQSLNNALKSIGESASTLARKQG